MALAELNSLGFETLFGYRTIALSSGDIAEVDANLRVISTHANPESPPTGGALRSLGLEGVLTNSDLEPVVLLAPHSLLGTWRTSVGTDPLLVLRVPGTHSMDEATARTTYERAVKSVFTALASMELDGHAFERVAMTVLGGSRGYEIAYVVHTLCTQAHRWLERSRSTRSFQIVVGETAHLDAWADALDEVLGRHVEDGANDRVLEALASEILERLGSPVFDQEELRTKVAEPLRLALDTRNRSRLRVGRLAVPGRVLAEYAVHRIETDAQLKKAGAGDLHGRIELLLQHRRLQLWVGHHLHALRLYGNEPVHFKDDPDRQLQSRDVPGLLASVLRVIQHLQDAPPRP